MKTDAKLYKSAFAAIGTTFRGEIWDNCARFKLVGKAYESMPREQEGHFDISTARHLAGPLRALNDPNVRIVFIIGATQVMKSIAGDIWCPFIMEHGPRNMLVLFETDQKAKLFCDVRLMDTIYQHPVLSNQFKVVDRHDLTKTVIKAPGMTLKVCGLNESNASSLAWPLIWISEAWQHGSDGLLRKAMKRADRFPNDCKMLIESQAGLAGEDLHREASAAHQVPLTWACPMCGGRQTWECEHELGKLRPDDFPANGEAKPGTYAGMKFPDGEDIAERARGAYWECFHCGGKILDTRENRQRIMDSYEQDYQITGPDGLKVSPKAVCFTLPKESARDNSFEDSAKSYLTAKRAARAGNLTPLADWYQQERAVFYTARLTQTPVSIITGSIAGDGKIPNERARVMAVDCQQGDIAQKTGKFWYVARAIDMDGKTLQQLARGYAESWKDWFEVQKRLGIPNANVAVDGGKYLHEILDAAAANFEVVDAVNPRTKKPYKARSVWKIFIGDGVKPSFKQDDGSSRSVSKPSFYERQIAVNGQWVSLTFRVYRWSNLSVKDHLHNLMVGGPGMPRFIALERDQLPAAVQNKEQGDLTYAKQMSNEYRTSKNGKSYWDKNTSSANNHYWDCECMCLAILDLGGCLGMPAAADDSAQTV